MCDGGCKVLLDFFLKDKLVISYVGLLVISYVVIVVFFYFRLWFCELLKDWEDLLNFIFGFEGFLKVFVLFYVVVKKLNGFD